MTMIIIHGERAAIQWVLQKGPTRGRTLMTNASLWERLDKYSIACVAAAKREGGGGGSHSRSQSLLGAWARGPGDSGDTGLEVLDFRTSSHFRFNSKLEDLQSLTLGQEQVPAIKSMALAAISNVVKNQKWLEFLESSDFKYRVPRTSWSSYSGLQEVLGTRMEKSAKAGKRETLSPQLLYPFDACYSG